MPPCRSHQRRAATSGNRSGPVSHWLRTSHPALRLQKIRRWRTIITMQSVTAVLLILFIVLYATPLAAAPAHAHPYLMPPAEKQRLLERLRSNESARRQFEAMKEASNQGKFVDAALVFALEADEKSAEVVRRHLLEQVRSRTPSLDADIATGGHRENNMEFYWDTRSEGRR